MDKDSVNYKTNFLNTTVAIEERLLEFLMKAEALTHIALSEDFLNYAPSDIHSYLWVLDDVIGQAKVIVEEMVNCHIVT